MSEVVTLGDCTLIHGDCREVLPTLGRFDAVITDPPYGIGEHGGSFRGRKGQNIRVLENLGWDKERPAKEIFELMLQAADHQIIWGGNYFADFLPPSKGWLYWQKLMGGDFADGELAWTSRDKALREFTKCPKGQGAEHPTQKPVALMAWCVEFFPNAASILDPFMGSGTTGVACVQLGRKFTGIERERKYFDIAVSRIDRALSQRKLFNDEDLQQVQQVQTALGI